MSKELQIQIRKLISEGDTEKAIQFANSNATDIEILKEIALISNKYSGFLKKRRLKLLSDDMLNIELNNINYALLNLFEISHENIRHNESKSTNKILSKKVLAITVLILGITAFYILNQNIRLNLNSLFTAGDQLNSDSNSIEASINPVNENDTHKSFEKEARGKSDHNEKEKNNESETLKPISQLEFDSNNYILIGDIIWMRNNLKTLEENQNKCYKNKEKYCHNFGSLFTWIEADKACKSIGWRLPDNSDWKNLITKFGCGYYDLPENISIGKNTNNCFDIFTKRGNSKIDFVLGGRERIKSNDFEELTKVGYYWSDTPTKFSNLHSYFIFDKYSKEIKKNEGNSLAISCRCVINVSKFKVKNYEK